MPTIFLISGPLGVGKTTLTRRLASHRKAALIDGDSLFTPLENVKDLSWDDRLQLTWQNILSITRRYLKKNMDIVIDFVVEDELEWFYEELTQFAQTNNVDFDMQYLVLMTDPKTLIERMNMRGDVEQLHRALSLLTKLSNDPKNEPYICHTTGRSPAELVSISMLEKFQYPPKK
jgi:gluconate kinase